MDRDAKKAEDLAKALDKIPDAVKRAYQAQQLGAISDEERKKYEAALAGTPQLYVYRNDPKSLDLRPAPAGSMAANWDKPPTGQFNPFAKAGLQDSPLGPITNEQAPLVPATPEQILDFVNQQIDKKMAENSKTVMANQVKQADLEFIGPRVEKVYEAWKQVQSVLGEVNKDILTVSEKQFEASHKAAESEQKANEDLQRQAQLKRDIQRSDLENQIESVKANALLTDQQKLVMVTSLQQQQKLVNDAEIAELEHLKAQVKSLSDQLELEKKIADLKHQNNQIDNQTTPGQQSSFGYQWGAMLTSQLSKWKGWAQESADSFSNAWNGATNSVSAGLTHLFEYGAQKGQWFREMWNGVIGSMISNVTKLGVEWVSHLALMLVNYIATEAGMTAATTAGASERSAIRTLETIMHNTLVALRLAAHVAGEMAATAITAVQAMARAIYHAIAAAIGAMESEASVPYVGVILGVAAAAAIMAAAYGMMGGFAAGGYTGDGHPSQVAGVVHAGEYVIPANRVQGSMQLLQAIHSGSLADSAAPANIGSLTPKPQSTASAGSSSQQQHVTHIGVYQSKDQMRRDLEQSDAHEKWVADISARTFSKLSS
jgi:hypothetical protein